MDRTDSRLAHSLDPASDDAASPLNCTAPADADELLVEEPLPWEGDPPEEPGRARHDAFTGAKKQLYLKALAKHGCILDACRATGISSSTVYNHQSSDPDFERYCRMAIGLASTPLELTAYERAVVGHEEPIIRGGEIVGTRIRRSDYMLRVLLQGADPKKYGARPGFSRKRLLKAERKRIEQEVRAEMAEAPMSFEDAIKELDQALDHFGHRTSAKRLAEGWTDLGGGVWIPPGWVWTGEGDPSDALPGPGKKDDAVCNSSNSSTSEPNDPEPTDSEVREPDDPCSWIPDQVRDDAEAHPPSFRRRPEPETTAGQSMNTDVREPEDPCSRPSDQIRDPESSTPGRTFPPPRAFPR